jgi:hypothetical protein
MAVINQLLLRKIVQLRSFGDARLQRTFDCVPCQIVCAIWKSSGEQRLSFPQSQLGKLLEIGCGSFFAIHPLTRG